MARTRARPRPDRAQTLTPILALCPECYHHLSADYHNVRTITTLGSVLRLTLHVRRCHNPTCRRYRRPYRPEAEPSFALPHHEFGLDVIALVGHLRYAEHRSIPEIHQQLTRRGLALALRTVSNLLDRYDELKALDTADPRRLEPLLRQQGRVVLAVDGLKPHVGHEVLPIDLWMMRAGGHCWTRPARWPTPPDTSAPGFGPRGRRARSWRTSHAYCLPRQASKASALQKPICQFS